MFILCNRQNPLFTFMVLLGMIICILIVSTAIWVDTAQAQLDVPIGSQATYNATINGDNGDYTATVTGTETISTEYVTAADCYVVLSGTTVDIGPLLLPNPYYPGMGPEYLTFSPYNISPVTQWRDTTSFVPIKQTNNVSGFCLDIATPFSGTVLQEFEYTGSYGWPFSVSDSGTLTTYTSGTITCGPITSTPFDVDVFTWDVVAVESVQLSGSITQIPCYNVENTWVGNSGDRDNIPPTNNVEDEEWWATSQAYLGPLRQTFSGNGGNGYKMTTDATVINGDMLPPVPDSVSVGIYVNLQGAGRPAIGWSVPITVSFFTPGADVLTDTPFHTFSGTTVINTDSGTKAYFECPDPILPVTYDITVDSTTTLLNVKRSVTIM